MSYVNHFAIHEMAGRRHVLESNNPYQGSFKPSQATQTRDFSYLCVCFMWL